MTYSVRICKYRFEVISNLFTHKVRIKFKNICCLFLCDILYMYVYHITHIIQFFIYFEQFVYCPKFGAPTLCVRYGKSINTYIQTLSSHFSAHNNSNINLSSNPLPRPLAATAQPIRAHAATNPRRLDQWEAVIRALGCVEDAQTGP